MARGINPTRLANVILKLQEERRSLQRRTEEIDAIFARCGIAPTSAGPQRGRPPRSAAAGSTAGGKPGRAGRDRRRYGKSGPQSLLDFIQGRGGASSTELSGHWKSEGRKGKPYITLRHLVKSGKLKKKKLRGQRGSQYTLA